MVSLEALSKVYGTRKMGNIKVVEPHFDITY